MKYQTLLIGSALSILVAGNAVANSECTTIKDGGLSDTAGNPISTGYDVYGYNYQAHMFNGIYDNFSRPVTPLTEGDVTLQMKWSNAWLSNTDCDGDGKLDRGGDGTTAGPSKGWLTNHENGTYENVAGEICKYTSFVKIVYNPDTCNAENKLWTWHCIIQENMNDQCGEHGRMKDNIVNPSGLGYWTN